MLLGLVAATLLQPSSLLGGHSAGKLEIIKSPLSICTWQYDSHSETCVHS